MSVRQKVPTVRIELAARFDSPSCEGTTNAYDGFGRVFSSTTNMGGTTPNAGIPYNAHGARTQITHPDNIFFGTLHDALDWLYHAHDSAYRPQPLPIKGKGFHARAFPPTLPS